MTTHEDKAAALAAKITQKAEDALDGIEREMIIMKWPADFRAIMWGVVAAVASQRADADRQGGLGQSSREGK